MPRPRVYKTPAIVLRQRKLGDTDKIVTLYTANYGKLDAVAKGVRRPRSKLAGHVEPLIHASFLLARGRNLDIVTQAETIEPFQVIRDDLDRLGPALYAAELLDRFTEDRAENFALYRLLLDTLRRIAARADTAPLALRFYEMALLGQLGFQPELTACVGCRGRLDPEGTFWSAASGGVLCRACVPPEEPVRPLSANAVKVLRVLQSAPFSEAAKLVIRPELAAEIERAMREYVTCVLEQEVRSAAFLDAVRRARRPRPAAAASPAEPA
ncbi:MAG TPA: DNA repair protein RecO [Dehalococcoidia bacterium]|nr:DNA repair protein RecO [Dehalococcoidia bacterium]